MRSQFLIALLIAILLAGTYWYSVTANVCPVPLHYRLGSIDAEFNLSEEEAKSYLAQAESVWEEEAGRELFIYDEDAHFTVNFVFGEEQELLQGVRNESARLDSLEAENNKLFATVGELQKQYDELVAEYQDRKAAYEERLIAYNQTYNQYSDGGNVSESKLQILIEEEETLRAEAEELSSLQASFQEVAEDINELSQRGNDLVTEYNRQVEAYNRSYPFGREVNGGFYWGDSISIYDYASSRELVVLLAHEFGHALGITHVEDDSAVMYYLITQTGEVPQLKIDDREALFAACGTGDEISHSVRRSIRTLTGLFK